MTEQATAHPHGYDSDTARAVLWTRRADRDANRDHYRGWRVESFGLNGLTMQHPRTRGRISLSAYGEDWCREVWEKMVLAIDAHPNSDPAI